MKEGVKAYLKAPMSHFYSQSFSVFTSIVYVLLLLNWLIENLGFECYAGMAASEIDLLSYNS